MEDLARLVLVSLLALSCVGRSSGKEELPKIRVGGWQEKDVQGDWNYNSTPPLNPSPFPYTIWVTPSVKGMSLICNASFPIEWSFQHGHRDMRLLFQYAIQTTRFSDGLDVVSFSSELSLYGLGSSTMTGNYTCQKVGSPQLSSSMYVYWEGQSPPYLTFARQFRKPPEIPYRKTSESFTLPCTVSVPTVTPILTKEDEKHQEIPIPLNRTITYDTRVGFTLKDMKDPYGRYTCQVGDAEEDGDGDIVTFNVVDKDDTPESEFNETLRHGAYYTINVETNELVCCAVGDKAPKLKLVECDHPTLCAVAKHSLHGMESMKKKNGSCSTVNFRGKRAGVFRCVGRGIDVVREYFFPIPKMPVGRWRGGFGKGKKHNDTESSTTSAGDTEEPYYDWYEADSKKMMEVSELDAPLYIGEKIKFTCKVSHFYYAQGIVWAVKYTNQSVDYLNGDIEAIIHQRHPHANRHPPPPHRHFQILFGRYQSFIEVQIDENLEGLVCYAPIWNSTEWGKKEIEMEIRKPKKPTIIGRIREDQTWFLNDTQKSISCKFDGEPVPNVTWTRNNQTWTKNVQFENGTSKLVFKRVSVYTQSTYECHVSNVAGTVIKKFRITVMHQSSSLLMVLSTTSVLGLIFIVVATVFLCHYLKSQKSVMQHLANLAFKDVTNNGNNTQQSTNITTPAPTLNQGTMSAVFTNSNGPSEIIHASPITPPQLHFGNLETENRMNNLLSGQPFGDLSSSMEENPLPLPADPGGYHKL